MAIPNGIIRFSGTWSGAVVYVYADLVVSPIDNNAYVLVVSSLSGGNDPSVPSANWLLMPSGGSGGTPTEITQGGATVACNIDGDILAETITLLDGSNTNIAMSAGTFNLLTTNATSENASIDITDAQIGLNSNKNIGFLVGGNEIFVDKATDKISILADAEISISAPLVTIDQIPPNAAPTSYLSYDASSKALSYTDPPLSANGSYESGVLNITLTDAIPFKKIGECTISLIAPSRLWATATAIFENSANSADYDIECYLLIDSVQSVTTSVHIPNRINPSLPFSLSFGISQRTPIEPIGTYTVGLYARTKTVSSGSVIATHLDLFVLGNLA